MRDGAILSDKPNVPYGTKDAAPPARMAMAD
jgi:hypothetical protein